MEIQLIWIVAIIGISALAGCFWKMKGGFGPFNLRVIGIVLISTFASLLAAAREDSMNATIGILGAIAGYLFGYSEKDKKSESTASIEGSQFGDNAKVAGRDINETINNLQAEVAKLEGITNYIQKIESAKTSEDRKRDYLFNTVYERNGKEMIRGIERVVEHWENEGWKLVEISSDYQELTAFYYYLFVRQPQKGANFLFSMDPI